MNSIRTAGVTLPRLPLSLLDSLTYSEYPHLSGHVRSSKICYRIRCYAHLLSQIFDFIPLSSMTSFSFHLIIEVTVSIPLFLNILTLCLTRLPHKTGKS